MKQMYLGDQKSVSKLIAVIPLMGVVFVVILGVLSPSPLNYFFYIFAIFVFIISLHIFFKSRTSFNVEISDAGVLTVKRGTGNTSKEEMNSIKFVGRNNLVVLISSRENIISIEKPTEEDRKLVEQYNPEKLIGAVTGWSKIKYGMQALQTIGKSEFEKGFGPYSVAFVSNENSMVKVVLKKLTMINGLGKNEIENARVFISLQKPDEFVASYQVQPIV